MAGDQGPAQGNEDNPAEQGNKEKSGQADATGSRRRKAIGWIAGVATAAVGAFVAAYFTVLGSHVAVLSTEPAAPGGPPVKIDLVMFEQGSDQSRVFPAPLILSLPQLASLNSLNATTPSYEQWFSSRGAVAADGVLIELVVQGNRNGSVRVISMQPVVSCQAPLTGTLFYSPSAGADLSTQLMLNLDEPLAPPRYIANVNGQVSGGANYFEHFTVSLTHDEQFTFLVHAYTSTQYCQFTLDMTVLDGGHTLVEHVSDNGKPFRVTAVYNEADANPGAFSRYRELYVGGVAVNHDGHNQFGDPLWLQANPSSYGQ